MPSAMVTFNGRITLPPHVRKQLGLKTGDSVEFVEIGNGRFALSTGAGSVPGSIGEPRGWVQELDLSPSAEKPGLKGLDETIQ